jgi:hypothetical protein
MLNHRQQMIREMESRMQRMEKEKTSRLQVMDVQMALKLQRMTQEIHERKVACRKMEVYQSHVQPSYRDMLKGLKPNQHGGELSGLRRALEAFSRQIDCSWNPEFDPSDKFVQGTKHLVYKGL